MDQKPSKFPLNNKRKTQKTGSNKLRFSFSHLTGFKRWKKVPLWKSLQDQEKFPKKSELVSGGQGARLPLGCNSLELRRAECVRSFPSKEEKLPSASGRRIYGVQNSFRLSLCSTCCSGKGYITTKFQLTFFILL